MTTTLTSEEISALGEAVEHGLAEVRRGNMGAWHQLRDDFRRYNIAVSEMAAKRDGLNEGDRAALQDPEGVPAVPE